MRIIFSATKVQYFALGFAIAYGGTPDHAFYLSVTLFNRDVRIGFATG